MAALLERLLDHKKTGGCKPILVVDDDHDVTSFLRAALTNLGYSVDTSCSSKEALVRLQREVYRLVITDWRMPGPSGVDVLQFIRKRMPQVPVILLTAYGTVETAVEAMKLGAFDYLSKPFSIESLRAAVERAVSQFPSESRASILTRNAKMIELLEQARRAASTDVNILIEGESGTGKELLARYVHEQSQWKDKPFVAVNCAALPESLLESELFGHEKGSFTGATHSKPGKFELAHEGTILLDEISEMAPMLQAKLLRVIQEKEVDRIGGIHPRPIRVRIIATTNQNLKQLVAQGSFRQDLYYRLNVVRLRIPPLRERKDDLPLLLSAFVRRYGNGRQSRLHPKCLQVLQAYYWPGNVRELENTVQRAFALREDGQLRELFLTVDEAGDERIDVDLPVGRTLQEMEKSYILRTLEETGGNRTRASKILNIAVRTLQYKLKKYGWDGCPADSMNSPKLHSRPSEGTAG